MQAATNRHIPRLFILAALSLRLIGPRMFILASNEAKMMSIKHITTA